VGTRQKIDHWKRRDAMVCNSRAGRLLLVERVIPSVD
jgi:hypothetical protein